MAASRLGNFSGLLSAAFREHDYQLGRVNCQLFLKNWFLLDARNPIFHGDDYSAPDKFIITINDPDNIPARPRSMRAIIPLVGELAQTPAIPQ